MFAILGTPCNENGNDLPLGTLLPPALPPPVGEKVIRWISTSVQHSTATSIYSTLLLQRSMHPVIDKVLGEDVIGCWAWLPTAFVPQPIYTGLCF